MSVSATQVTYELPQSEELEPVPEPQSDVTSVCTPLALIIVTVRYSFADSKSPLTATPRLKPKTVGAGVDPMFWGLVSCLIENIFLVHLGFGRLTLLQRPNAIFNSRYGAAG